MTGGFFDSLPVETLVKIFEHCLRDNFLNGFRTPLSMHDAPLLLCLICVRWRRVAMSTPGLWSSFSALPSHARNATPYLPLMTFFLSTSRPHPLSFGVPAAGLKKRALIEDSFPLFLAEVHSWHDVTLHLTETLCSQFLAASLDCDSRLEALSFPDFEGTNEQAQMIPAVLSKFPRLRRLEINLILAASVLELPWSQLTNISIGSPLTLDHCVDALNKCSKLVHCSLTVINAPHNVVKPHNAILPALIELRLGSTCDVGQILARVTCPTLAHLTINHNIPTTPRDLRAFSEFFDRSSCKLETFRLADNEAEESDIIRYVSTLNLQSLKYMQIHGRGIGMKTFASVTKLERNRDGGINGQHPGGKFSYVEGLLIYDNQM